MVDDSDELEGADESLRRRAAAGLVETLSTETYLALIMASFLTAAETTWLRVASPSCQTLVVRNCPAKTVQSNSVFLYFDEQPSLPRASALCMKCEGQNRHSPRTTGTRRKLLGDRDVALAYVARYGRARQFADESFRRDRDVALADVTFTWA
mmetsp:Transcript_5099/g.16044  ORF Transcript_5099/g.16044 Transcript_5099/m.16044 type:complete len:153 (+) Transcript_5099:171-629(+)